MYHKVHLRIISHIKVTQCNALWWSHLSASNWHFYEILQKSHLKWIKCKKSRDLESLKEYMMSYMWLLHGEIYYANRRQQKREQREPGGSSLTCDSGRQPYFLYKKIIEKKKVFFESESTQFKRHILISFHCRQCFINTFFQLFRWWNIIRE